MQTGSETLFASTAPGQISHRREIGQRNCASVRIFTGPEIWSNGSSTRSSTVGVWQPATTSSRPTTSHSSSLRPYGCGCALMIPRPKPVQLGSIDNRWVIEYESELLAGACIATMNYSLLRLKL